MTMMQSGVTYRGFHQSWRQKDRFCAKLAKHPQSFFSIKPHRGRQYWGSGAALGLVRQHSTLSPTFGGASVVLFCPRRVFQPWRGGNSCARPWRLTWGAAVSPVSRPPVRCYNGLFLSEKPIAFSNTSIRPSPQTGKSPSLRNRAHRKAKRGSSTATASPVPVRMLDMSSDAGPLVRFFSVPPQLRPHARHWGDPAS